MLSKFNTEPERRESAVYYCSPDLILQRKTPYFQVETPSKTETIKNPAIRDVYNVQAASYKDGAVAVFGGEKIITFDKNGNYEHFDINKSDVVTTLKINNNTLAYGTLFKDMFQFVIVDLDKKKRIYQSASILSPTLSYHFGESNIYVMVSNSQIVCFDYECKQIWRRFEPNFVVPGISSYRNKAVYAAGNQLRLVDDKVDNITLPIIKPDKVHCVIGDRVYGICGNKKNIFCFDLQRKELIYEFRGEREIVKMCHKEFVNSGRTTRIMLFSTAKDLGAINLDKGTLIFFRSLPKIRKIEANEDFIVTTHEGISYLLREKTRDSIIEL